MGEASHGKLLQKSVRWGDVQLRWGSSGPELNEAIKFGSAIIPLLSLRLPGKFHRASGFPL